MSLHNDQAAIVVLPPGVSADGIEVRVLDENDVERKARQVVGEQGRRIKRIVEIKYGGGVTQALIVETE